jgi:FMN phosphatase YigB (HAD superfamily)
MNLGERGGPIDWAAIRLVAFDVDGTLYRQKCLRGRMALSILGHAAANRTLGALRVLRAYRRIREDMAEREVENFEPALIQATAAVTGRQGRDIRAIVREWIEERPLPHLFACRYQALPELFAGLRRNGKIIGVLSDYPATAKLAALGLTADHVVHAGDDGVGVLKPHPRGLRTLMTAACARPSETVLIGDRADRDGEAARRAGALALIRSSTPVEGWRSFASYNDPLFASLVQQ